MLPMPSQSPRRLHSKSAWMLLHWSGTAALCMAVVLFPWLAEFLATRGTGPSAEGALTFGLGLLTVGGLTARRTAKRSLNAATRSEEGIGLEPRNPALERVKERMTLSLKTPLLHLDKPYPDLHRHILTGNWLIIAALVAAIMIFAVSLGL